MLLLKVVINLIAFVNVISANSESLIHELKVSFICAK